MKIRTQSDSGNALISAMIFCTVLGLFLAAYLTMASNQVRSSARSTEWNMGIAIAEAGIEEGFTHLHVQRTDNLASNGWSSYGGGFYKINTLGDARYIVAINSDSSPTITAVGYVLAPTGDGYIDRTVQVTTRLESLYAKALVAKGQIDLNGNHIHTDSFDSFYPGTYSDLNGDYDSSLARDNGDVATNSGLVDSLNVGNADIKGKVATGYGGTISMGSNGVVGDAAWHAGGNTGIKPKWSSDDMNVSFPDVEAPWSGSAFAPIGGSYGVDTYEYHLTGGNYQMSSISLNSNQEIMVSGDSTLYVTGAFSMTGNAKLLIENGATLTLYVDGDAVLGGNGIANTGKAENFIFKGMPNCTSMSLNGNGEFTGVIYAPYADMNMNGAGSGHNDFIGSGVFNTITMNGHFNFHYDENLENLTDDGNFVIASWNEL
jgi:hypothetical protein